MKQIKQTKRAHRAGIILLLSLMGIATSCADKDVYDPNADKNKLPAPEEYFGFETRGDYALNVNYGAPGFKAIIEIYDRNPMQENGVSKKEGVRPIFTAYTGKDSKYAGNIYVPTTLTEAYMYTERWGLPVCVELEVNGTTLAYDGTKPPVDSKAKSPSTRAPYDYVIGDVQPYPLKGRTDNLMALGRFDRGGKVAYNGYSGSASDYTPNYLTTTTTIKGEEIGALSNRVQAYFDTYTGKRTELLKPAAVTNMKVTKEGSIDLIYLTERAEYLNSIGYYYYDENSVPTEADFKTMRKYVVMPNVDNYLVRSGSTIRLKYFGKDGKGAASEKFPAGTVIGWFLISDGWDDWNSILKDWNLTERIYFFSNDTDNNMRFVAVKDAKTGAVVLGCEDQPERTFDREKEDYSDILFFIKSDDAELDDTGKPSIPDADAPEKVGSTTVWGTLAYEDIWPNGGDYDLNDVIVEYERVISYDGNNLAIEVVETFKPVQPDYSAQYNSYFAYQLKNAMGELTLPANVVQESATNSIVITKSAKVAKNESFVITRNLKSLGLKTEDVVKDFNPYIIVGTINAADGYKATNRLEVHLPKYAATSAIDKTKIGSADDAYFVDKDGAFPFAIDIPVLNFKAADETKRIDSPDQYPAFKTWAESKGTTNQDWYLKK